MQTTQESKSFMFAWAIQISSKIMLKLIALPIDIFSD